MEIVNKVAQSALEVFDLEDYYPEGKRLSVDLAQWLYEGLVLREKDFRESLRNHDWSVYKDAFVAVHCSSDAIIPAWATILVTTHLVPFAKQIFYGTTTDIDAALYGDILLKIDYSPYQDKPVIIKGCSRKPVPLEAYVLAVQQLQPVARSIMYGEACSAVPLYKRK